MVEPRRWTLSTGERHTYFMGSSLTDDEVVEVIEAAPVEAEIKRLRDHLDFGGCADTARAARAEAEFEIRCAEERTTTALTAEIERLQAALKGISALCQMEGGELAHRIWHEAEEALTPSAESSSADE